MIDRDTLHSHLHQLLEADRFRDYGPNGLQVEGKQLIRKVVTGVTASLALIEAAIEAEADAILVHITGLHRDAESRFRALFKCKEPGARRDADRRTG